MIPHAFQYDQILNYGIPVQWRIQGAQQILINSYMYFILFF